MMYGPNPRVRFNGYDQKSVYVNEQGLPLTHSAAAEVRADPALRTTMSILAGEWGFQIRWISHIPDTSVPKRYWLRYEAVTIDHFGGESEIQVADFHVACAAMRLQILALAGFDLVDIADDPTLVMVTSPALAETALAEVSETLSAYFASRAGSEFASLDDEAARESVEALMAMVVKGIEGKRFARQSHEVVGSW